MEGQHGCGIVRDTVVRPGCEMELLELQRLASLGLRGKGRRYKRTGAVRPKELCIQ